MKDARTPHQILSGVIFEATGVNLRHVGQVSDEILAALSEANLEIGPGWNTDMSEADPKQYEYIQVWWSYVYGDDGDSIEGYRIAEFEDGQWVDQEGDITPTLFTAWKPIIPPCEVK